MEIGNLVLIYFENSWHTLCDETWNSLATTTLCNQLGQGQGEHSYSAELPQIFHLYKCLPQYPSCSGSEDHLNECKWIDSAGQPAENKLYLHVKCQSSLISSNQGKNSTDDPSNGKNHDTVSSLYYGSVFRNTSLTSKHGAVALEGEHPSTLPPESSKHIASSEIFTVFALEYLWVTE